MNTPHIGERTNPTIQDWMVTHKYATNGFAANYIFSGLELAKVPRFWMRVKLIVLYRLHRDSGEPSKVAYAKALTGKRPMELFKLGWSANFAGMDRRRNETSALP